MKTIINTVNAPKAVGPYSQAVSANGFLFISGQIPLNPQTGEAVTESFAAQTEQVIQNLSAILNEAGLDFSNVVKASIFITDMSKFAEVNEVYKKHLSEPFPARETVEVSKLPLGVNVEISMIATL